MAHDCNQWWKLVDINMKVWIPKVRENSHIDQEKLAFKERLSLTVLMRSGYNMLHIDR